MAKSKFEYVRQFETEDRLLPHCWIVVRLDGKAFHRFCDTHHYMKPNDERGLNLMTRAAHNVMEEFKDIILGYGHSDEYSFVFHRNTTMYNRRGSKLVASVASLFSSSFTLMWPRFFSTQPLQWAPVFEGCVHVFPSDQHLHDYLSWTQADCHVNNLYNTCFWKLIQDRGLSHGQAQDRLKGTLSSDKNELLFSDFKINYNTLPELYRKGTVLIHSQEAQAAERSPAAGRRGSAGLNHVGPAQPNRTAGRAIVPLHSDLIGKQFWEQHPYLLAPRK
ncbi:hypothetical protein ACOMHN_000832 [Nucella lapillus]